jgi:hypothetical protein
MQVESKRGISRSEDHHEIGMTYVIPGGRELMITKKISDFDKEMLM